MPDECKPHVLRFKIQIFHDFILIFYCLLPFLDFFVEIAAHISTQVALNFFFYLAHVVRNVGDSRWDLILNSLFAGSNFFGGSEKRGTLFVFGHDFFESNQVAIESFIVVCYGTEDQLIYKIIWFTFVSIRGHR